MSGPKIVIIAGPNGAGKTTFAQAFLPQEAQCPRFINADLIAAGLSPFAPEAETIKAGRLMLQEIAGCAVRGESFAFETTLAGRVYLRHIEDWRRSGYHVSLFFVSLPTAEMAVARVAERVRQGGMTFRKPSFGVASSPGAGSSQATTATPWMPGRSTTTPGTNLN